MSSARILYPDFRAEVAATRYPFSDTATLQASNSKFNIGPGTFIDAVFYAIGAGSGLHIARIETGATQTKIVITDADGINEFTATYNSLQREDAAIEVLDVYGRSAGYLLAASEQLAGFGTQIATYEFDQRATEFAATVVIPAREPGVRGLKTPTGTLITKDVWLIGDMGVQLSASNDGVIRVDVIGEPLFKRAVCESNTTFPAKKYLKTINGCPADVFGNFILTASRQLVPDSILRIYPTTGGIVIAAVGRASNG
jgi:hypothetical protein